MAATGTDLASLSVDNVSDGIVRLAAADAMATRSDELAVSSVLQAERGVEELTAAAVLGQAGRELTAAAATDAVVGGAKFGATQMERALESEQQTAGGS